MIPVSIIGNTKQIHFIGIGGIGVSGLAEYFLRSGYKVSGSDMTASHITNRLKSLGAEIFIGHSAENIKGTLDGVVYSSAVKSDNPEMIKANELNIRTVRRAEMLGEIVNDKFLIAVSGTHGKTTTTAMIAKVLIDAGCDPLVFVGGNVELFEGGSSRIGRGSYAVVEADEYDRSFLTLTPDVTVVTSIDEDHLDIYKDLQDIKNTFAEFCGNSKPGSKIVYFGDDKNVKSTLQKLDREKISYGFGNGNYYRISGYYSAKGTLNFSVLNSHSEYRNITLSLIGRHNVLNSTACFAVSKILNINFEKYKQSIKEFAPVARRLQLKYNKNDVRVYDDYAHHPKEIEVSLKGLKEANGERIITVFQPHLFSRTKDFYREFAKALLEADEIILLDIYPAREKPIKGVTSEMIFNELIKLNANARYLEKPESVIKYLSENVKKNDTIVFQGAGDITMLCDQFIKKLSAK